MQSLIFPKPLKDGATIGVVCPSSPAHIWFPEKYEHGINELKRLGFCVKESKLIKEKKYDGYRTAGAEERAEDFMLMVEDSSVDILISVIGGMCSTSMLKYLDYKKIREERKIFSGYSDITSLHMAIFSKSGLSTLYGPAIVPTFGEWPHVNSFSLDCFLSVVKGEKRNIVPPPCWTNEFLNAFTDEWKRRGKKYIENDGWHILREGDVSGEIIIANLNTLIPLLGTEYCPPFENRILLLEEMDAPLSREERSFASLELHGVFNQISGLIIGKPENFKNDNSSNSYDSFLLEALKDYVFPVLSNFDCSHTSPMIPFFEGEKISMRMKDGNVTIEEDPPLKDIDRVRI